MFHHLGIFLQVCVLTFLPCLILYQLQYGIKLVLMPACTVGGILLFWLGTMLREKT